MKEALELAARLARIFPKVPAFEIAMQTRNLVQAGREATKIAEAQCDREPREANEFERRREFVLEKATRAVSVLMVSQKSRGKAAHAIKVEVTSDPRGPCLRLHTPDLGGNTWGGDSSGYGVIP